MVNDVASRAYSLKADGVYYQTPILLDLFGTNFGAHFHYDVAETPELLLQLKSLNVSSLRFPGGSITEDV